MRNATLLKAAKNSKKVFEFILGGFSQYTNDSAELKAIQMIVRADEELGQAIASVESTNKDVIDRRATLMKTVLQNTGRTVYVTQCYALSSTFEPLLWEEGLRIACPCCEGYGRHWHGEGENRDTYVCAVCAEYGYFNVTRPDGVLVEKVVLSGLY